MPPGQLVFISHHHLGDWAVSEEWTAGVRSGVLCANPEVWTDGSLVRDEAPGVSCGGAGLFASFFWLLLVSPDLGSLGFAST